MEEMLMYTGLLDKRRRGREITYIMLAFRGARTLADLKMNSNEFTLRDAIRHVVELTPYGWCKDGHTIRHDMEMALRNPGYTMGYLIGKVHLEKLLADRAMQLGDKFNLRQFIDEFLAAGMIPLSLIRWEMTGNRDEIRKLSGND
jgi:uncharacterized protein (DUF885 family)